MAITQFLKRTVVLGLFTVCVSLQAQKYKKRGPNSANGFDSWNKFQGQVSEELIKETADAMATNGMKKGRPKRQY